MEYQFEICGVDFILAMDTLIVVEGDMAPFRAALSTPQVRIDCRTVEPLCPAGQLLGEGDEKAAYQDGNDILRVRLAGKRPYAALRYRPDTPGYACLDVEREDWHWCTDHLRLWTTVWLHTLLLQHHALVFHASYIEHRGWGVLFTAPSGTGKSTQAELWRIHRAARVINGDKAGVRVGETPTVHGVPFSGTSGICHNVSAPLRGIVVLSQAKENTVRRLRPSEAVAALFPNVFVDNLVSEEWQAALHLLLDLVSAVPVYALACTPDERAVEALERAFEQEETRR